MREILLKIKTVNTLEILAMENKVMGSNIL